MNDPYHQGQWLKEAVIKSRRSTAEFSRKIGVARETMQRWYNEPRLTGMRPHLLWKILDTLGLAEKVESWGNVREDHDRDTGGDVIARLVDANTVDSIISSVMRDKRLPGSVRGYTVQELQEVGRKKMPTISDDGLDLLEKQAQAEGIPVQQLIVEMLRARKLARSNRMRLAASRKGATHRE